MNCRSIIGKHAEFTAALEYIKPDVVCGTESWLNGVKPGKPPSQDHIKSSEIFPDNYTVYRNDRDRHGGGDFILVRDNITSVAEPDLSTDCEAIWTKIKTEGNKDLHIGCFYMPQRDKDHLTKLDQSLSRITANKNILLAGDFNCPNINWGAGAVNPSSPDYITQEKLLKLTQNHGLEQVHLSPTREDNLLDLVFTNNPSLTKASISVPGISDHDIVVTDFLTKPRYSKTQRRKCFLYSKANWADLKRNLKTLSDEIEKDYNDGACTRDLWDKFHTTLSDEIHKLIPHKLLKKTSSLPWIDRRLRGLMRKKAKLHAKAKKSGSWSTYRNHQRICKQEMRQAEWNHINKIITEGLESNNSKPFWKYIKCKKTDNIGVAPLKESGRLVSESKGKAQILLNQFKSVFTPHTNDTTLPPVTSHHTSTLSKITINNAGVTKLLKNINPAKASGPDDIPNRVLKECAEEISPALTAIFQRSIDSGQLPEVWLRANVAAVYKKGDKHLPENYRPISLTSVISKLLEHIICHSMLNHFDENNILTDLNHGFRSGYSCETQLLITANDLLQTQNKNQQTDLAILDFSKAFDTVPHNKLIHKLSSYGIQGPLLTWLTNFLTQRRMKVVLEGEHSEETDVKSGVPQGTVLGPLLFLVHINDLPTRVKSQVRLFADDCLLYRAIKSARDHITLQEDLLALQTWASDWGMRFNAKKCYILSINNKSSHFYTLNNTTLQQVTSNPYLGITISQDLKWSQHIAKTANKANSTLGLLRRNLKFCPKEAKRTAYLSMIRSTLEYGAVVWDPYKEEDIKRLERVQKRGVRFITGDYKSRTTGCVTEMLANEKLEPLKHRRRHLRLALLFKIIEEKIPALPPADFLTPKPQTRRKIKPTYYPDHVTTNIVTNQAHNNTRPYTVPRGRTDQYKHSFFVQTVLDWNHLDNTTVTCSTVEAFRSRLATTSY